MSTPGGTVAINVKRPRPESFISGPVSSNVKSSPVDLISPDQRAIKKLKTNGTPTTGQTNIPPSQPTTAPANGAKDAGQGTRWIVACVEDMEKAYTDAILTATLILRFKAACIRMGSKDLKVPLHLEKRLKRSWSRYESTRRHVEWFMSGNTRPSSSKLPPIPLAEPTTTLTAPLKPPENVASPVPLSQAAYLAFDPTQSTTTSTSAPLPPAVDLATLTNLANLGEQNSATSVYPDSTTAIPTAISASDFQLPSSDDQTIDFSSLSGMNMDELAALMNGENFPQAGEGGLGDISAEMAQMLGMGPTSNTESSVPPVQEQVQQIDSQAQAETDQLLASLGDFTGQSLGLTGQEGDMTAEADAILASLTAGGGGDDNAAGVFNFNLATQGGQDSMGQNGGGGTGDVDISALMGLFANSSDATGNTEEGNNGLGVSQPLDISAHGSVAGDFGAGGGDMDDFNALSGINMDDFDFGGDMPNVDGDEFKSLLEGAFDN